MTNINIGSNIETFTIDGDESRVIHFDRADFNIIARCDEAAKNIAEYMKTLETPTDSECASLILAVNDRICEHVDYIFGEGAAKAAFAGVSPISVDTEGVTLYERFFDAIIPIVKDAVEKNISASQKRMAKYTRNAK